jgi:hypothetical protein
MGGELEGSVDRAGIRPRRKSPGRKLMSTQQLLKQTEAERNTASEQGFWVDTLKRNQKPSCRNKYRDFSSDEAPQ